MVCMSIPDAYHLQCLAAILEVLRQVLSRPRGPQWEPRFVSIVMLVGQGSPKRVSSHILVLDNPGGFRELWIGRDSVDPVILLVIFY